MNEEEYPFFSIGYPERERLEVHLLSPPADNETEGIEWIQSRAIIQAGAFSGSFDLMIDRGDMVRFKDELEPAYNELKGIAEFKTLEDQIYVKVEVDQMGHVKASGYVKDDAGFGNRLEFGFTYDQTLLWHTISEIDEALFMIESMSR